MLTFIFGVLFAGFTLLVIGLQRTYGHYPVKEIKRQARAGDPLAKIMYRPVSYGLSLEILLGAIIICSAALSFVLLASTLEFWFALIVIAFLLWAGFFWLPSAGLNSLSFKIAIFFAPAIEKLTSFLHPVLKHIAEFTYKHKNSDFNTKIYEPEDLVNLLEYQKDQPENRISHQQIDLLIHSLTFADKKVSEILVPLRSVKMASVSDSIGPSLMDELYKSGFSRFPVYEGDQSNVVGTLFIRDIVQKKSKSLVRDLMRPDVFYVHEDYSLDQALRVFIKTKHHMLIVVNSFEEFIGILTLEDVLEQIIGEQIVDEFDSYEDIRAVAASAAAKDHAQRQKTAKEPTEVIE